MVSDHDGTPCRAGSIYCVHLWTKLPPGNSTIAESIREASSPMLSITGPRSRVGSHSTASVARSGFRVAAKLSHSSKRSKRRCARSSRTRMTGQHILERTYSRALRRPRYCLRYSTGLPVLAGKQAKAGNDRCRRRQRYIELKSHSLWICSTGAPISAIFFGPLRFVSGNIEAANPLQKCRKRRYPGHDRWRCERSLWRCERRSGARAAGN